MCDDSNDPTKKSSDKKSDEEKAAEKGALKRAVSEDRMKRKREGMPPHGA